VLDGIELKVPEIDAKKSGVTGCSRLGKAALAAGLFDKRIAVTMPMCSGIQGAGPYRYSLSGQGENLENSVGRYLKGFGNFANATRRNLEQDGGHRPAFRSSSTKQHNSHSTRTPSSPPSRRVQSFWKATPAISSLTPRVPLQ
jgi:hypothetical protein